MNDILKVGISFGTGAGIGAAISWYVTKKKADKEKDIEIQSVKESFARQTAFVPKKEPAAVNDEIKMKAEQAKEKPAIDEFVKVTSKGSDISNLSGNLPEDPGIRIITAGEYSSDEYDTYKKITLMYYNNDILFDTNNKVIIEDYLNVIGSGTLDQSDDVLYVRNDAMKTDFDIQKVDKPYVFPQE